MAIRIDDHDDRRWLPFEMADRKVEGIALSAAQGIGPHQDLGAGGRRNCSRIVSAIVGNDNQSIWIFKLYRERSQRVLYGSGFIVRRYYDSDARTYHWGCR
jgi:hypothetical protein